MTQPTIRRYDVPTDGQWYRAELAGEPIHVVAGHDKVTLHVLDTGTPQPATLLGVFAEDQPIDCPAGELTHVGSAAVDLGGGMFGSFLPAKVHHLFQRPAVAVPEAAA
jgi:hypothetical protein